MKIDGLETAYPYDVSVIMAVYNVGPFLEEAIESLIDQMIGFDRIQLILVDDGSTDNSPSICDEYAQRYPANIIVVHKENAGVSSARNVGLSYATGKYVNFLDSDDKFSPNTIYRVLEFFSQHFNETDVVAIPLFFFDGASGQHPLNAKFKKGSRVIDLYREPSSIQLSMSSTFIKKESLSSAHFDEDLAFAEDAKVLLPILAKKGTLGVVHIARYYYRKRTMGELSAIQKSQSIPQWYFPYLEHFQEETMQYFMNEYGCLPKFVQHTLAYDLQWRIKQDHLPEDLFPDEESSACYKHKLIHLIAQIDDDVLLAQKSLWHEHKLWALKNKYHSLPQVIKRDSERFLRYGNTNCYFYSNCQFTIEFVHLGPLSCTIEGYTILYPLDYGTVQIEAEVNGEFYPCDLCFRQDPTYALGDEILHYYGFTCTLPLNQSHATYSIRFFITIDGQRIEKRNVVYKKYAPIGNEFEHAYYTHNGWTLKHSRQWLTIEHASLTSNLRNEFVFCKELWRKNQLGTRKAIFVRFLAHFLRALQHNQVWLICDKANRADDNGEAFFNYLQSAKPKNVTPYFLIRKDSGDWERLSKIGKVIPYMSHHHKLKYLTADFVVSAYSHDEINNPFLGYHAPYRDMLQNTKFVFLQHGIIKDDVSRGLNKSHKNIKGFVTSCVAEYNSVINTPSYLYKPEDIWLTGLPRYDYLYHAEEKSIVIMPTWRRDLFGGFHPEDSRWDLLDGFKESDYYQFYNNLLKNPKLLDACSEHGYSINFVPHPVFFPYMDQFDIQSPIKVWGSDVCYRDMFARNKLLLTDYSSVAFDFAYLRKPVLYAHFDTNHYAEGYFDYERDGFGEVSYDVESTVDNIISYLKMDCALKDCYRTRIDSFFAFNDTNSCQRVLEKMLSLKD